MVGALPTQGSPHPTSQAQAPFVWENSFVFNLRATLEQLKAGGKKTLKRSIHVVGRKHQITYYWSTPLFCSQTLF
jgi:hypothetical protein